MKNLAGKTAFVTGAASGIGLGIATALAQAGVKVMLCDIEEGALARAVEGLKLTNADVDGVRADVSLKTELKAAAVATIARYGKVHILVNNAGVGGDWTDAGWDWTLGVNLMAVIWGIEIFGPLIEAAWRGWTHRLHGFDRGLDLPWRHCPLQCLQIRRCRTFGRIARRLRSAGNRRFRALSRIHPHSDHELGAQPARTFRSTARGESGRNADDGYIQNDSRARFAWDRSVLRRRACARRHRRRLAVHFHRR